MSAEQFTNTNSYTYENPLPRIRTNPDALFDHLCVTASSGQQSIAVVRRALRPAYEFSKEKFTQSSKPTRVSGEPTVTHGEMAAAIIAEIGLIDLDLLAAALLHDVFEDTDTPWEEIERVTNPHVVRYAQILTKVRTQHLSVGTEQSLRRWIDDQKTQQRLVAALDEAYEVYFVKGADVDLNQEIPLPDERATHKAEIALYVHAPVVRRLGAIGIARRIEDNAFRILHPEVAGRIEQKRNIILTEQLLQDTRRMVDQWTDDETAAKSSLQFLFISVDTPHIYEIFQHSQSTSDFPDELFYPTIRVCSQTPQDMMMWYRFLASQYGLVNGENTVNPFALVDRMTKTVVLRHSSRELYVPAELTTQDALITPLDMFVEGGENLSDREKEIAQRKLDLLRESYRRADQESWRVLGQVTEEVTEHAHRGSIVFFSPAGKSYALPAGATYLDAAYRMGMNLGNHAVGVTIVNNNGRHRGALDDKVRDRDRLTVIRTAKAVEIGPRRYDLVSTKKALHDIQGEVQQNQREPWVQEEARERGIDILLWLYKEKTGRDLDIDIAFGLDQMLQRRHQTVQQLATRIGFVPIPACRKEHFSIWKDLPVENETLKELGVDAHRAVDSLISVRRACPTIVVNLPDEIGVGEKLEDIGRRYKATIQSSHTLRDHKSPYENGVQVHLLYSPLGATLQLIVTDIYTEFPGATVQEVYG